MKKKELNFEINILPILDILSVLICFLLLTAVWVQIGTIDTKQALGDNSSNGAVNPPSLWIGVGTNGTLKISLRDVKNAKGSQDAVLGASAAGIDWKAFGQKIDTLHAQIPELKTVVISPEAKANYGDVIRLMDQLKQKQLTDIGLSPLG